MIQVHVFQVPLGQLTVTDAVAALHKAYEIVNGKHAALLGMTVGTAPGAVEIELRVSAHDRWGVQRNARLIAAVLARRAGLPYKEAVWLRAESEPNARHLTKEGGREFSHASRGPSGA